MKKADPGGTAFLQRGLDQGATKVLKMPEVDQ